MGAVGFEPTTSGLKGRRSDQLSYTPEPTSLRRAWQAEGVKGDRVEVVVDIGDGVRTFEIVASKAGRRVEISSGRGMVEVLEVTRSGQPVRSARFMQTRVVALVEHPATDGGDGERTGSRRTKAANQPSLSLSD